MITEGNKHGNHRITFTSITPGTAKDQDAYRSDLTGIYNVTSIIETICEKHNIRSKVIKAACNGTNAIIRDVDTNTTYLCQTNNFELIFAIEKKLMKYPLTWSWINVKVNQDEKE